MRFLRKFTAVLVVAAGLTAPGSAGAALELKQVGSFDKPDYVTSDPGDPNRVFVLEGPGRIQLIRGGSTTTFLDIDPIVHDIGSTPGDYGLYSMAFSPGYATNHLFYVAYSGVDGNWHLDEFSANGDTADPASRREVLTLTQPTPYHWGGQLQFGPDGYLYASTGDGVFLPDMPGPPGGDPDGNAQNLANLLGKILRIDPQGAAPGQYTVPADNPFANTAGCADGCDEIWSYGLRNPWRFSFDRLTGDLVIGDVGYESWEEVDFDTGPNAGKGDNFGWNCRDGAHPGAGEASPVCAARAGTFTEPVFEYAHQPTPSSPYHCAITGGYVVRDRALADLYGRYLYADFCTGELRSLALGLPAASGDRFEGLSVPHAASFGQDADCRIYVASYDGPVYRLTDPAGGAAVGCLTLDLGAKKQPLRKRLTFFATATADSNLLATSKAIKQAAKELAANQKTKVKVKLKRAKRQQLQKKLNKKGKAKIKIAATATVQGAATATDTIKVKLED